MTIKINTFTPMKDKVFVTNLEEGARKTEGGIILADDNGKVEGIRPRWGQVYCIGSEVEGVEVGDWILVQHGRWTQRLPLEIAGEAVDLWMVEYPKSVEIKTKNDPRMAKF